MSDVAEVSIRRVPRRTRWLPRWAWHVTQRETTYGEPDVQRVSGYARTWRGAALRVGRLVAERADR